MLFLLMTYGLQAQYVNQLSWSLPGHTYSTSDIEFCSLPSNKKVNFKVNYQHCEPRFGRQCIRTSHTSERVRFRFILKRGNTTLKTEIREVSSSSIVVYFNNITVEPGKYRVLAEVSTSAAGFNYYTNEIKANRTAVPNFNINGYGFPGGDIINVCASTIFLNAEATSCETRYYVGVQESDQWWNRTYQYEWGRWFTGEASLINLQQLSLISSVPPYFTGPASRQNQGLLAGNLPSGNARHYRVNLCTNQPNWDCKIALIRVYSFCKISPDGSVHNIDGTFSAENTEIVALYDENNQEIPFDKSMTTEQLFANMDPLSIQAAPNPFTSSTTISIDNYDEDAPIVFELFNALGERVKSIEATQTQFEVQRDQLTAGIYLYRATANNKLIGSGKLIIE